MFFFVGELDVLVSSANYQIHKFFCFYSEFCFTTTKHYELVSSFHLGGFWGVWQRQTSHGIHTKISSENDFALSESPDMARLSSSPHPIAVHYPFTKPVNLNWEINGSLIFA